MPSASILAMMRSCSPSATVSASSMSMIGMSSRTAYRRFRRGLYSASSSARYHSGPLSSGQARISSSSASSAISGLLLDQGQYFRRVLVARLPSGGLEVQPQQRLGVRRAQVEPPVGEVHRQPVETVLVGAGVGGGYLLDDGLGVADLAVDLAGIGVALERPAQLRQRLRRLRHELEDDQGGDQARVGPVVVAEVVVPRVLAAEDGAGVGHDGLDE